MWRNRVYDSFYFIREILPLLKEKLMKFEEVNKKPIEVKIQKNDHPSSPSVLNSQKPILVNQNSAIPSNFKDKFQSPNKNSISRKSGEQSLTKQSLFVNKNLSSISPSLVSNGSINANSFFNIKRDSSLGKKFKKESKKSSLHSLSQNQKNQEKIEENKTSFQKCNKVINPNKKFINFSSKDQLAEDKNLLKLLEIEEDQNEKRKESSNKKMKDSIKTRLMRKKAKQNNRNSLKSKKLIQEFRPKKSKKKSKSKHKKNKKIQRQEKAPFGYINGIYHQPAMMTQSKFQKII
jgi:hypothetical protein